MNPFHKDDLVEEHAEDLGRYLFVSSYLWDLLLC